MSCPYNVEAALTITLARGSFNSVYIVTWGGKIEEIYFLCTLQGVFHSPVLFRDEE